ncbi:MAG: TlpA family protein disulfide reductase [Acidobacteria bacterium]|nr:TlpA family protein disulfide reductase [Acidobacteriota bacterium]
MSGETVDLDSLKGKVVLVTFWSTRCPICESEIPKLNKMAAAYRGKDVVFLAPTMDNPTRIESFLRTNPFDFEILPNSFGILLKYADPDNTGTVNLGFPAYFLVNQKGEVEMKASGWDKIDKLDSLIKNLLNAGK